MPFNKDQDSYIRLREIISERTNPIVAWVGSGLSQPAGLPSWGGLRANLLKALRRTILGLSPGSDGDLLTARADVVERESNLWTAFEVLEEALGETSFRAGIRNALAPSDRCDVPSGYKSLWRLPLGGMLNLNLDRLATRAFTETFPGKPLVEFTGVAAGEFTHVLKATTPFIANLHGTKEQASSWVLTRRSLEELFASPGYRLFVESCVLAKTLILVGIAADDVAAGGHLWALREQGVDFGSHYWMTDRADLETRRWAEASGVQVVSYASAEGDHGELHEVFDDLLSYIPQEETAPPVEMPTRIAAPGEPPVPAELAARPAEEIRQALNSHASQLLSRVSSDGYGPYEQFCKEYDQAIYRAWYVSTDSPDNVVLGYELNKEIAQGAFGRVFSASSPSGEEVALKLLHADVRRRPDMLQSFRRGVRSMHILAQYSLKGIVAYREASEIPAFVVMDMIDGLNLKDAVDGHFVDDWASVLQVAVDLTGIIRRAHRVPERVLHRDLRPTNVMLKWDQERRGEWEVVVLDFDLSWHLGATELSVVSHPTIHGYLAPEQYERREAASTRNAAVDSFGLAMTLYFLRSGREPRYMQHRDREWEETVMGAIRGHACSSWVSLPNRYARLILNSTRDRQQGRWDMSQVEGELEQLQSAELDPRSVRSAELVAEELSCRAASSMGGAVDYDWDTDRMEARMRLISGVTLRVAADESERSVRASFEWASDGGHDVRRVQKYLFPKCQEAMAGLRKQNWRAEAEPSLTSKSCSFSLCIPVDDLSTVLDPSARALGAAIEKLRFS